MTRQSLAEQKAELESLLLHFNTLQENDADWIAWLRMIEKVRGRIAEREESKSDKAIEMLREIRKVLSAMTSIQQSYPIREMIEELIENIDGFVGVEIMPYMGEK